MHSLLVAEFVLVAIMFAINLVWFVRMVRAEATR